MKQTIEPFEELFIPRKDFHSTEITLYRVYSDYKHFELVEATSALDALSKSKVKTAYKIQRHDPLGDNIIHFDHAMSMEAKNIDSIEVSNTDIPPVKVEASADIEAPIEQPPAAAGDAPLSNDDVEKLLNS